MPFCSDSENSIVLLGVVVFPTGGPLLSFPLLSPFLALLLEREEASSVCFADGPVEQVN